MIVRFAAVVAAALVAASPAAAQPLDTGAPPSDPAPEDGASSPDQPSRPAADTAPPPEPSAAPGEVAPGAIDTTSQTPPPARLSGWELAGRLLEPESVVRGFLAPVMRERDSWTDNDQRDVVEFLRRIGYHSIIRNEPQPGGGVRAVLVLEPVTLVRRVRVDIDASFVDRVLQPLFADEIRRRMSLRPGSPLELDRKARAEQLQMEAERLALYLRNDGFYEAEVSVTEERAGDFASEIVVDVDPGPAYYIGELTVTGNTAMETAEITAMFHHERLCVVGSLCAGQKRFSRQQLNQDIERLVETYQVRGYPGVRIRTDFDPRHSFHRDTKSVEFTIEIRERRKIDVVFEGNDKKEFSDDELFGVLTLAAEGSYDDVEVESSAEAIRRHYQKKGYFEANVTWERVRFGVFERILFSIDEGPSLRVRQVRFHGNEIVGSDELRSVVKTQVYQRIIIGESGGYATSLQLSQDVDRILELYRRRGYPRAEVRLEVSRDPELVGSAPALAAAIAADLPADGLYVHFHIDEGPQVMVEDVLFAGASAIGAETLVSAVALSPGEPFLESQARADGDAIRRFYFARGYPRAEVETEIAAGSAPDRMVITHSITENGPARVGQVALRGNFKTQDWVLRDELRLKEGELLTVESAELAQANLRQSGLFSAVQIDYIGLESTRQEVVNVLVSVEERHDYTVAGDAGGGYSTDVDLFVEGTARMSNIAGIGARLDSRLLFGQELQLAETKLALPRWIMRRLLGTDLLFETAVGWQRELTERFGELTTYSGSVAFTKEGRRGFFEGWLLSLRYDFRQRQRNVDFVRVAGNNDDIDQTKVTNRSSAIGPVLVIDKRRDRQGRKNPLSPAAGFRLQFRASLAEDYVLGTDRFVKLSASGQHFFSLGDRFVVYNGLRYDHGIPLGGSVLLPEVERFFAGGDTTVRGFEEDRLATEIIEEPLPPLGDVMRFRVLPAGGNIRFIHNLDLQIRVWDDPWFDFPIASAIFLDTGLVENSLIGFQTSDLRHSLGVALARWVTPFGALSVEYAIPLDPELGDNPRGRFHINLGVLF